MGWLPITDLQFNVQQPVANSLNIRIVVATPGAQVRARQLEPHKVVCVVYEAHLVRFEIANLDVDLGTYRFSHMLRVQPGNVAASLCRILIHTESSQYGTYFLRTPFPRGERCREFERFSTPKFTVVCPVVCDTRTASGGPSCLQLPSRDGDFGLMIRLSGSRGVLQ